MSAAPISDNKKLLNKVDRRTSAALVAALVVLFVASAFNIGSIFVVRQDTLKAREANRQRQDLIINHIDCIVLLSKTHPEFNFQTATLDQTKVILKECVVTQ